MNKSCTRLYDRNIGEHSPLLICTRSISIKYLWKDPWFRDRSVLNPLSVLWSSRELWPSESATEGELLTEGEYWSGHPLAILWGLVNVLTHWPLPYRATGAEEGVVYKALHRTHYSFISWPLDNTVKQINMTSRSMVSDLKYNSIHLKFIKLPSLQFLYIVYSLIWSYERLFMAVISLVRSIQCLFSYHSDWVGEGCNQSEIIISFTKDFVLKRPTFD